MADVEVWLRGPLPDVPPLLQPVAHALIQAREEVTALMDGFPARGSGSVRRASRRSGFTCTT